MNVENVIIEFQLNDNIVYVTRIDYQNKKYKHITEYIFSFGTLSGGRKTHQSTYKSIKGVMKKFNNAVDSIKKGTQLV